MITLSVDDGCESDVRLADLAERYEIPVVFYWPVEWHSLAFENGYKPLDYNQAQRIANKFEIGSHTITHRLLTRIDQFEAVKEIAGSKFMLERMFNKFITKFAPPRGYTSPELNQVIYQHYQTMRLTKQPGLVHIHPESGVNDNLPWRKVVNNETKELWCHGWELDKYYLWDELEEFLREYSYSQLRAR